MLDMKKENQTTHEHVKGETGRLADNASNPENKIELHYITRPSGCVCSID